MRASSRPAGRTDVGVRGSPFCSIVVATRDRPAKLRRCLQRLAKLDYPRDRFEVIVVDDGGSVPLAPVVQRQNGSLDVTLVTQGKSGPAGARNAGARRARGDLLVFTDDDCEPRPDWLRRLAAAYTGRPDEAVGGLTVNALPANPYAGVAQTIIDVGYAQRNGTSSTLPFFTTNNLAVPATGFRRVGGFDAAFTTAEDRDFCARWAACGGRIAYQPDAVVAHAPDLTLWSFCRQFFAYGGGAFRFHRKQAQAGRRVKIEPSYYLAVARRTFARRPLGQRIRLGGLLLVWHFANS